MSSVESKVFLVLHLICWTGVIALTGYWIYVFTLNNDLIAVDYKKYYDGKKDVFPVLSLCFSERISNEKLKSLHPNVNSSSYLDFLYGNVWKPNMSLIDFPKVISNMTDYIEEDFIRFRNGSYLSIHSEYFNDSSYGDKMIKERGDGKRKFSANYAFFAYNRLFNCYELSVPHDKEINEFFFRIKTSIFPSGIRHQMYGLVSILHYPNQLYISSNRRYEWPFAREKMDSYMMKFHIRGVEVLRRRQKWNSPCNENWQNQDSEIIHKYTHNLGCRPPYLKPQEGVPLCSTKEQMKKNFHLRTDDYGVLPPCQEMKNIWCWYEESTVDPNILEWGRRGFFWIGIVFSQEDFKEISQIRYNMLIKLEVK